MDNLLESATHHAPSKSAAQLRARTKELLIELAPVLDELAEEIAEPHAVNGTLSRDDLRILPLLRSSAVVEGLTLPPRVMEYFEAMMARVGIPKLPYI